MIVELIVVASIYTSFAINSYCLDRHSRRGKASIWVGAKVRTPVRRQCGKGYRFYFANPQSGMSACQTAERLMKISGVDEVMVTEGEYRLNRQSRSPVRPRGRKVSSEIQNCVKGNLKKALILQYRK